MITYSVDNRKSFENVANWIEQINELNYGDCCMMMVGNKVDLPNREVSYEEALTKSKELKVSFIETSAKSDVNINEAFTEIVQMCVNKFDEMSKNEGNKNKNEKEKSKGCCTCF